jgi:hypothetical protein
MACAASPSITADEVKWKGEHFMLIKGRWGFDVKEVIKSEGEMREVTPGKWVLKKVGMVDGVAARLEKREEGMKSVQVKEPSWVLLAVLEGGERGLRSWVSR